MLLQQSTTIVSSIMLISAVINSSTVLKRVTAWTPLRFTSRTKASIQYRHALFSTSDDSEPTSLEPYLNPDNRNDQVFAAISGNGSLKVTVATTRNLVNENIMAHEMSEVPADALGRLMTCGLLIGNGMQDEQVLQISVDGDGPLRGAVSITSGEGECRGYVGNPALSQIPLTESIGLVGTVQVVKNHPSWPNPYNGITSIRTGEIDADLGAYLAESEQRSCALAAGTVVKGVLCSAAGGYIVEQLPGCDGDTIKIVEKNLARLVEENGDNQLTSVPTGLLSCGKTPVDIANMILDGLDMKPLGQVSPIMKCKCSTERLFRSVRLLDRSDVDDILEKQEILEARCHFCGKVYRMSPDEVQQRFEEARGDPTLDEDFEEELAEKKEGN